MLVDQRRSILLLASASVAPDTSTSWLERLSVGALGVIKVPHYGYAHTLPESDLLTQM